jgi:hypothetical protein
MEKTESNKTMSTLAPPLSHAFLYFAESRQLEYALEFDLTRGKRCVLTAQNPTWMDKLGLRIVKLQILLADKAWEQMETDFLACFDSWRQGDESLEEYISDNPDEYFKVEMQEIVKCREQSQRKLILIGETILNMSGEVSTKLGVNPFLDAEKIGGIVQLLRDDLEDRPSSYFHALLDEERSDESQRQLGLPEAISQ